MRQVPDGRLATGFFKVRNRYEGKMDCAQDIEMSHLYPDRKEKKG